MSSSFAAKIRLSRGQKQIYLYFAEAEYLRRSQRLGLSFGKSKFYLHFAEAHPIFYKDRCGIARKDFRAKILSVALKI